MKNGEWGMGNGEWGMGNGKWEMGNGKWGMGNGKWGMGNGKLKNDNVNTLLCSRLALTKIGQKHLRLAV